LRNLELSRIFSSHSPSHHRPKRSSPNGRRAPNEVHRENPIPSACLGVFGLSQHTGERDLKGLLGNIYKMKSNVIF
jgi:hypothetical protein